MDITKIPHHVAIIMDGNGRWAKSQGKPRIEGHYQGVASVRTAIQVALDTNIKYLTIYAFSKENWGRPKDEVDGLMELFCKTIALEIPNLCEQGVCVRFLGSRKKLNPEVLESIALSERETQNNNRLFLNVALNYSGRAELTEAVKQIVADTEKGLVKLSEIDENTVSSHLYTHGIPDPDLLIRTSGEYRISNFLLWQSAYSEFYFTEKYWPDFTKEEFLKALEHYSTRKRRYGLTDEQK